MARRTGSPQRVHVERGIFKRHTRLGDARYELCYLDSDRRQRWKTEGSLREARLVRADLVARVRRGERVAPSRVTLAQYAESWLPRQKSRLRPSTYRLYGDYLRLHVNPRLGRRRLQEITVADIALLISEMQDGIRYADGTPTLRESGKPYAGWTTRGVLVVLGRLFSTAAREGILTTNPIRQLEPSERPKCQRRRLPSLDRPSIGRLIEHTPARYRTLVAVSVLTGIRQGEALGLRWRDVDLDKGLIRITNQLDRNGNLVEPKTNAAKREIPTATSLTRLLKNHKETGTASGYGQPVDFVFASARGTPLHYRNLARRALDNATAAANLPKLRWHDLRHLAASALIAQGASVAYLARVLGHSSPAVTLSIYAHEFASAEHADRAREQMEQAFGAFLK